MAATRNAIIRVGVDNLFNKQPPIINVNLLANNQDHAARADPSIRPTTTCLAAASISVRTSSSDRHDPDAGLKTGWTLPEGRVHFPDRRAARPLSHDSQETVEKAGKYAIRRIEWACFALRHFGHKQLLR